MSENNENKEPLNKNNKVPKLRFPEFQDHYQTIKLTNCCEVISGGTPDTNNLSYWNGKIDWFTPTEIGLTKYVNKSKRSITELGLQKSSAKTIKPNSILLTSRATIGAISINLVKCSTNQGFQSLVPKAIDLNYLYYLILTPKFQNELFIHSSKSTFLEISHKEVCNLKVTIPLNINEQNKIGMLLDVLDSKIQLLDKKISALKKYKEGLIKHLINSSNSMIDISKIIKVCEKTKFGSSDGSVIGKYKFFTNSSNDEIKYINNYTYDGEYLVLNTGGSAFANYVNERFSAMSDCLIVKPTQNYSMSIYYWLKASEDTINYVGFQGTGLKHLDINWLLRQKVKIIDYDNKKLLSLNEMIDSIIKLNSSMLDWLKKLKSYLLSNLFI